MPEPIILVIGGVALYKWVKGKQAPASDSPLLAVVPAAATAQNRALNTMSPDALATNTSVTNQGVAPLATGEMALAVPSDLVAALDNQTALAMRAYASLNPPDFQAFLAKYADRLVLRNDFYFEALTNPPEAGYELTPAMIAGLGTASYKVAQALNGVYVGRSVDLFGVTASVAGQIPSINPDLVSGLQAAAMSYRAITSMSQVFAIAAANNVAITELMSFSATALTAAGAYPGLAALPLSGVLMAVGLVVDIGFTIIGDKPDLQKAVDVALDVASLAVLFIPVIGVVIAIVIQLVKFIIDLFGEDLFGGGMSHEQREVLETARYGSNINPMFPELAASYTPRELFKAIIGWGSGYCGGYHVVAMGVNLKLKAGDTLMVGGQLYTVPPNPAIEAYYGDGTSMLLGPGNQPGCYWLANTPFANITNDEQAWAFGAYASVNGVVAMAQAGIADWRKEQFNTPTEQLIAARTTPMREFLVKYKLTLDQVDQIALEYRAQPHLNELALAFGWATWQEMFAAVVADEWQAFLWSTTTGTLSDFSRNLGYASIYAFRAAALSSYETAWARVQKARVIWQARLVAQAEAAAYAFSQEYYIGSYSSGGNGA